MTEELAECLPSLYATEGGTLALDLASPEGEDYLDLWCSLIIDLSGGPFASTWRKSLLTQRSTR